jgi:hypothetical protein
MKPGRDMPYGWASSLTLAGPRVRRSMTSRRVASDRARNTWSRAAVSAAMRYMDTGCSMLSRLRSLSKKAT